MKKEISYFVSFNGLCFSFDFACRYSNNRNKLFFERKGTHSKYSETLCSLDLNINRLVFKHHTGDTYYFEIVPVGGANND